MAMQYADGNVMAAMAPQQMQYVPQQPMMMIGSGGQASGQVLQQTSGHQQPIHQPMQTVQVAQQPNFAVVHNRGATQTVSQMAPGSGVNYQAGPPGVVQVQQGMQPLMMNVGSVVQPQFQPASQTYQQVNPQTQQPQQQQVQVNQIQQQQQPSQMQQQQQQAAQPHQVLQLQPKQTAPASRQPPNALAATTSSGTAGDDKNDAALMQDLKASDTPSCTHNRWMLMVKRKRYYIMECMVCRSLWKTKLKCTQKCTKFFSGRCPLDDKCPHPHVYSRTRLRRESAATLPCDDDDDDEEEALFQPCTEPPLASPHSADQRTRDVDPNGVVSVNLTHRLLISLEQSRRSVVSMEWWATLLALAPRELHLPCNFPDWLTEPPQKEEPQADMTCRSLRSSLRMVKWNDFPGSSFMVTSSGRSEPPELLDGESVAFASMSANPEKFFSLLPQTLGVGSFGPINAAVINDYDGLCECVDEGTREWLREERPCVAVQIIELGQLDEKKTAKVMDELECLIGVPRHASLPRVVGTFSLMRNQLWAVTDACISKEQAASSDEPVTLADFIKVAGGSLEPAIIKRVMAHIAGGLAHLHSRSWIHLNVHTRAILHNSAKNTYTLSSYKSVVFCETNKTCSPPPPTPMSQLMFVPSEHHGKKGLPNSAYCSHKSDVYALGVCGAIMQGMQPAQVPAQGSESDSPFYSFLRCCLDSSFEARLSAEQLLKHPYLSDE